MIFGGTFSKKTLNNASSRKHVSMLYDMASTLPHPAFRTKLDLAHARRGDGSRSAHRTGLALVRVGIGMGVAIPARGRACRPRDPGRVDVHVSRVRVIGTAGGVAACQRPALASNHRHRLSQYGPKAVDDVYPRRLSELAVQPVSAAPRSPLAGDTPAVVTSLRDGVLLAFDHAGLVALAWAADCTIELVPQVGDFVATGDPLFRVSRGSPTVSAAALCHSVALGQERTVEQDPTFVFRMLVDIAAKALSPAINDPTTAVLVLDQIQHLLRTVGNRHLDEGQVHDEGGQPRFVFRTPDWDDFVQLAVTEIRLFGGDSIQVTRRLRAMLENLIQVLPEQRLSVLRHELSLLHKTAERLFLEPEDRALAAVSDLQGVGSSHAHLLPSDTRASEHDRE